MLLCSPLYGVFLCVLFQALVLFARLPSMFTVWRMLGIMCAVRDRGDGSLLWSYRECMEDDAMSSGVLEDGGVGWLNVTMLWVVR